MPYPAQIDESQIVDQAWQLVDQVGERNFSLAKLAAALGVKAPSLYRHVGGKADLLRRVNLRTLEALFARLQTAVHKDRDEPEAALLSLFRAYRNFAHTHPHLYQLLFHADDQYRPDEALLVQMVLPVQEQIALLSGAAAALPALRGALALLHGFVMLELTNQLRRGGDLDAAFNAAAAAYLRGWQLQIKKDN